MSFTFTLAKLRLQNHPMPKPLLPLVSVWRRNASARDRVIDFGKHKGKMLGTLPSSYLKWVSRNLRTREFEEWATLADQVLEDPVYQDRIQWEFAHNILSNNHTRGTGDDVVSELLEIGERFGWDWDCDKAGWRNVNFELLGTSKGGRIPRINSNQTSESETESKMKTQTQNIEIQGGRRRRERRDRLMLKRETSKSKSNGAVDKTEIKPTHSHTPYTPTNNPNITNPFPGRQALLNRATNDATPHSRPSSS